MHGLTVVHGLTKNGRFPALLLPPLTTAVCLAKPRSKSGRLPMIAPKLNTHYPVVCLMQRFNYRKTGIIAAVVNKDDLVTEWFIL